MYWLHVWDAAEDYCYLLEEITITVITGERVCVVSGKRLITVSATWPVEGQEGIRLQYKALLCQTEDGKACHKCILMTMETQCNASKWKFTQRTESILLFKYESNPKYSVRGKANAHSSSYCLLYISGSQTF